MSKTEGIFNRIRELENRIGIDNALDVEVIKKYMGYSRVPVASDKPMHTPVTEQTKNAEAWARLAIENMGWGRQSVTYPGYFVDPIKQTEQVNEDNMKPLQKLAQAISLAFSTGPGMHDANKKYYTQNITNYLRDLDIPLNVGLVANATGLPFDKVLYAFQYINVGSEGPVPESPKSRRQTKSEERISDEDDFFTNIKIAKAKIGQQEGSIGKKQKKKDRKSETEKSEFPHYKTDDYKLLQSTPEINEFLEGEGDDMDPNDMYSIS